MDSNAVNPTPVAEPVKEPEPVKPAPVVKAPEVKKAPVVETKQTATVAGFDTMVDELKRTGTAAQKGLINSLETYMVKMKPGVPMAGDVGAQEQYKLWKAISSIVESSPVEEFTKLWSILLMFFNEFKKAAFDDKYIYRFSEYWMWSDKDLNAFQRIVNIMKLTADPKERALGLKQVDLNRSLAEGFSEEAKQRIANFYS